MSANKISINLNPHQEKASGSTLGNIYTYIPVAILAALVLLVVIALLQLFSFKNGHSLNSYKKEWQKWEAQDKQIKAIKSEIINLENDKSRLQQVLTPQYDVANLFEDIFSTLPKNIWFESIKLQQEELIIRGYVVKWKEDYLVSVDKFICDLQQKEFFSSRFENINITESRKGDFNNTEVLQFIIECKK